MSNTNALFGAAVLMTATLLSAIGVYQAFLLPDSPQPPHIFLYAITQIVVFINIVLVFNFLRRVDDNA